MTSVSSKYLRVAPPPAPPAQPARAVAGEVRRLAQREALAQVVLAHLRDAVEVDRVHRSRRRIDVRRAPASARQRAQGDDGRGARRASGTRTYRRNPVGRGFLQAPRRHTVAGCHRDHETNDPSSSPAPRASGAANVGVPAISPRRTHPAHERRGGDGGRRSRASTNVRAGEASRPPCSGRRSTPGRSRPRAASAPCGSCAAAKGPRRSARSPRCAPPRLPHRAQGAGLHLPPRERDDFS